MKKAKVYSITSVKGGTGKTTFSLNLAATFALAKQKVLLIDLDLAAGDIAARLDVEYEKDLYHCYEDVRNHTFEQVEDYIYPYKAGIDVLPAPKDPRCANKIEVGFLTYLLSKLSLKYDVILLDTNHLLSSINLVAFDYSDKILFIINNECMNLRGMRTMSAIFEDMDSDKMVVILNDSNKKAVGEYSISDMKNIMKREVDFRIPKSFYQKKYDKYTMGGKIFLLEKRVRRNSKRAVKVYRLIATALLKED
jgi:pilus assembly protein CpaE